MVVNLLHHLQHTQVYGAGWNPPEGTAGAGGRDHQTTFNHLSAVLAHQGGHRQMEAGKCSAHLQKGPEGRSREVQVCQPDLDAGEKSQS